MLSQSKNYDQHLRYQREPSDPPPNHPVPPGRPCLETKQKNYANVANRKVNHFWV